MRTIGWVACLLRTLPAADIGIHTRRGRPGRGRILAARGTEKAPKVVYSASLEEIASEANQPLKVNINTADIDELDELPQVGPSTAQKIVDYRRANGMFRSVDELEEVSGIGPKTLEEIKPFAEI